MCNYVQFLIAERIQQNATHFIQNSPHYEQPHYLQTKVTQKLYFKNLRLKRLK